MNARPSSVTVAILALVLLAVALTVFLFPGSNTFYGEGDSGLSVVRALLQHGRVPFTGVVVSGNEHFHTPGPLYFFLLAPVYWCWPQIVSGFVMSGLCTLLTVFGLFLFGRRYFNDTVGLWAAAFYASSVLIYIGCDLQSWSFSPPLMLLLMWAGSELLTKHRRWAAILIPPLMVSSLQLYYSTLSLFPSVGWALVASRRWVRRRDLLVGLSCALLLLSPYLFVGMKADLPALSQLLHHPRMHREAPYLQLVWTAMTLEPRFWQASYLANLHVEAGYKIVMVILSLVRCWFWWILLWIGVGWWGWKLRDSRLSDARRFIVFILLWSVAPFFVWSWSEGVLVLHYLYPAKIGQILIMACFVTEIQKKLARQQVFRAMWVLVLSFVVLLNVVSTFLGKVSDQQFIFPDPYLFTRDIIAGRAYHWIPLPQLKDTLLFHRPSIFPNP